MTADDKVIIHLQNTITRALNALGVKEINYIDHEGFQFKLKKKIITIRITVK